MDEQQRKRLGFMIGLPLMLVFMIAGAMGAWKGGSTLWLDYTLERHGHTTTAKVTRSVSRRSGGQSQRKRQWRDVTYEFATADGTWRSTVEIDVYQRPPQQGNEIIIHYLPENPGYNWPLQYIRNEWGWLAASTGSLVALFSAFIISGMIITRVRERTSQGNAG